MGKVKEEGDGRGTGGLKRVTGKEVKEIMDKKNRRKRDSKRMGALQ